MRAFKEIARSVALGPAVKNAQLGKLMKLIPKLNNMNLVNQLEGEKVSVALKKEWEEVYGIVPEPPKPEQYAEKKKEKKEDSNETAEISTHPRRRRSSKTTDQHPKKDHRSKDEKGKDKGKKKEVSHSKQPSISSDSTESHLNPMTFVAAERMKELLLATDDFTGESLYSFDPFTDSSGSTAHYRPAQSSSQPMGLGYDVDSTMEAIEQKKAINRKSRSGPYKEPTVEENGKITIAYDDSQKRDLLREKELSKDIEAKVRQKLRDSEKEIEKLKKLEKQREEKEAKEQIKLEKEKMRAEERDLKLERKLQAERAKELLKESRKEKKLQGAESASSKDAILSANLTQSLSGPSKVQRKPKSEQEGRAMDSPTPVRTRSKSEPPSQPSSPSAPRLQVDEVGDIKPRLKRQQSANPHRLDYADSRSNSGLSGSDGELPLPTRGSTSALPKV